MFAARQARLSLRQPRCSHLSKSGYKILLNSRRTFLSSAVETLSEGFLDLAIALPLPPSLPPYSTTIIIVTVISRLVFTVPFSIWAQERRWRVEEIVKPTLKAMTPIIKEEILQDMKKKGVFKVSAKQYRDKKERAKLNEDFGKILTERLKHIMSTHQKKLLKQHNCRPLLTSIVPVVTQLPLFFVSSVVFGHLSQSPTPFDSESFLTLTNLSHTDPTTTLPIVLGFLTLANVESSSWFMTEAQQREKAVADEKYNKSLQEAASQGTIHFEGRRVVKSILRVASIGRVILAAMVPGGVVLYWVSSATFGLLQTWAFDYWKLRRKRALPVPLPSPSPRV